MKICDNNIFSCDWSKKGSVFRIWLIGAEMEATAENFADAEEALASIIEEHYQCASPILTYLTPSPDGELPRRFARPDFLSISGVKQAALISKIDQIFTQGKCASCSRPKGRRTDLEMTIEASGAKQDALYVRALKRSVFSKSAIEQLGIDKVEGAILRRVNLKGSASSEYFEIISFPPLLCMDAIPVKGLMEPIYKLSAKHCSECGFRSISYMSEPYYIECFRREPINNAIDIFISQATGSVCLRGRILRKVLGEGKLDGVATSPVGFATGDDVDCNVSYRELARGR